MRSTTTTRRELPVATLVEGYLAAFDAVIVSGFAEEVDWQAQCRLESLTESGFLREAAWVILAAGMRERVIRERFPRVSAAFLDWCCAASISRQRERCTEDALQVYCHRGKIAAIAFVADWVARLSFHAVLSALHERGVEAFAPLPYIGPVTKFHLAKNLGMDVAKPDRHLVRLAYSAGFSGPERMCRTISEATGDRIATVDLVLWRYATLEPTYTSLFERLRLEVD